MGKYVSQYVTVKPTGGVYILLPDGEVMTVVVESVADNGKVTLGLEHPISVRVISTSGVFSPPDPAPDLKPKAIGRPRGNAPLLCSGVGQKPPRQYREAKAYYNGRSRELSPVLALLRRAGR